MNELSFSDVMSRRRSQREFNEGAIDLNCLNRLIWAAQGKTNENGGRTVPSAHAVHPLRLFVNVSNVHGLDCGLYAVESDTSELKKIHDRDISFELQEAAVDDQTWIGNAAAILSICADFVAPCIAFADQPPFGRRGSRYVYIEAGAAAQNVQLQAAFEEIGSVLVAGFNDEMTGHALGLTAPLAPVLHLCLGMYVKNKE